MALNQRCELGNWRNIFRQEHAVETLSVHAMDLYTKLPEASEHIKHVRYSNAAPRVAQLQ